MKLHYHIQVNSPPDSVWQVISDPHLMELWNPKCVRCDVDDGPFGVGFSSEAVFRMGKGPERQAKCTIEAYETNHRLVTIYSGAAFRNQGYVRETFHLVPRHEGTLLKQTVDFGQSGVSFIIQLIMKIIHAVGYSVGRGPLGGIKALAEGH